MEPMQLREVIKAINGSLLQGDMERVVTGIATDSRSVRPGELFFALPGERTDGHLFAGDAMRRGAIGAVISRTAVLDATWPLILVPDTLRALQDLAQYYRNLFQVPVVAVTGSTGKTTTKDLIAGALGSRFRVLKTEGNQNNELGLPLTLLQLNRSHEAVVLEMAMRGRGEIAALCRISRPHLGVITNIGKTHLERLGSQEAIADAKGELLTALPPDGCAILNGEDPWLRRLGERITGRVIYYGNHEYSQVRAVDVDQRGLDGTAFLLCTPGGEALCSLPFPGVHNVQNALAAAAAGHWFGLTPAEIARGLESAFLTGMRLEVKKGIRGSKIIDDSYNASPASANAALRLLAQVPGKRRALAVLGDMYELGAETVSGHREVGITAAALKIDYLCTVGELAREIAAGARFAGMSRDQISVFDNKLMVIDFLKSFLGEGDLVLVKGSRGLRMEQITAALCEQGEQT